jgi:hypothetical protein
VYGPFFPGHLPVSHLNLTSRSQSCEHTCFSAYSLQLELIDYSEEAVEYGELDIFLRLKEEWSADDDDAPKPPAQPIGVPGAVMPLQMTPEHLRAKIMASPQSSPSKVKGTPVNKITNDFDLGTELSGYGLQGVRATEDELRDLVAELGLDGDEAGELVKGLAGEEETRPSDGPGHSSTSLDSHSKPSGVISSEEPAPASRADPVVTGEGAEAVSQGSEDISKVETKDIISEESGTSDAGVKGSDYPPPTSSIEAPSTMPEGVAPVPEAKTDESVVTKTSDKVELSLSDAKDAESCSS